MRQFHRSPSAPSAPPAGEDPVRSAFRSLLITIGFFMIFGILLILLKSLVLQITTYIIGAGLCLQGGWLCWDYFHADLKRRLMEPRLAAGLISLVIGVMLLFSPNFLNDILPFLWGLALLFSSFLKIQYAFDERSAMVNRWWIMLVLAAVSVAGGILSLTRPGFFGENAEMIIGIMLIVEAGLDIAVYVLLSKAMNRLYPSYAASPERKQVRKGEKADPGPKAPVKPKAEEASVPEATPAPETAPVSEAAPVPEAPAAAAESPIPSPAPAPEPVYTPNPPVMQPPEEDQSNGL